MFATIQQKIASFNLPALIVMTMVLGLVVTLVGVAQEMQGQHNLIAQGDVQALQNYEASLAANPVASVPQYIGMSLQAKHTSFGGNTQGIGLAIIFIAPLLLFVMVFIARKNTNYYGSPAYYRSRFR